MQEKSEQSSKKLPPPIKLQKPGAGLPFLEALIVKYFFGQYVANKKTADDNFKTLEIFTQKILKTIEGLSAEQLEHPVLVPKLQGLEDSSRYWSIHMTLEHLLIVGKNMKHILIELSHERIPPIQVDIAKVKPLGSTSSQEIVKEFKLFFENVNEDIKKNMGNYHAKAKLYHPWLGDISVKKWHWLLGTHQGIHYNQIKHIKEHL